MGAKVYRTSATSSILLAALLVRALQTRSAFSPASILAMAAVAPMAMERDARVPCCEPLGCVTDCVYPWCMFTCDTCCWATLRLGPCLDKAPSQPIPGYCLWPSHKVLKKDPKRAAWLRTKFDLCQRLDRYTIRHPRCRCCGVGFGSELHASTYLGGSFYGHYDDLFGANFCCGQKVVVAEPRLVETSLLEPSGRAFHLHMYNLRGEVMPKIGGETSFLLALPNGDDATTAHARLRALVFKYCAGPAAIARARPRDPVAAALLWKLRTSCAEDPANAANVHFPTFVVRFVHYCVLGMRDIDDGAFALLFEANITPVDAGEFPPHGVRYLHREMNLFGEGPVKHFPELHAKIAALYAAALRELRFEGEFCAAEDFAASLVPIMALAGCFGPLDALLQLFPEHNKWSNLADPLAAAAFAWPWDDRAKLRLCAMEAQRLSPGVFGTTLCGNQPVSWDVGAKLQKSLARSNRSRFG